MPSSFSSSFVHALACVARRPRSRDAATRASRRRAYTAVSRRLGRGGRRWYKRDRMQEFRILGPLEVSERRRADRPRRPAPARASGGAAPAGRPGRPDGAARRRALRRRAAEDRDGVAPELGRRAPEGARAGRPRHAPARDTCSRCRPDQIDARRFEQLLGGRAERRPGRAARAAPPCARALARPAARRVRLRRLGAGGDPPARGAPARRARGADRRGRRARPPRRRRPRARGARRRAPAARAALRAADARALPRGAAGRRAERLQTHHRAALDELGIEPGRGSGSSRPRSSATRPASTPGPERRRARRRAEIVKAIVAGRVVPVLGLDGAADLARELARAVRRTRATGPSTSRGSRSTSRR